MYIKRNYENNYNNNQNKKGKMKNRRKKNNFLHAVRQIGSKEDGRENGGTKKKEKNTARSIRNGNIIK